MLHFLCLALIILVSILFAYIPFRKISWTTWLFIALTAVPAICVFAGVIFYKFHFSFSATTT